MPAVSYPEDGFQTDAKNLIHIPTNLGSWKWPEELNGCVLAEEAPQLQSWCAEPTRLLLVLSINRPTQACPTWAAHTSQSM